jgi:hypothetical protein
MFHFAVDFINVQKTILDMREKIARMPDVISHELAAWQTEDMHRKNPFVMKSKRAATSATVIRQHSLREMKASARYQSRTARKVARGGKRAFATLARWQVLRSQRAILRAELLARLQQRIRDQASAQLHWK